MEREKLANYAEYEKAELISAPAVDSFLSLDKAKAVWPESVTENKEFIEQIESRAKLNESLDEVIGAFSRPDMELEDALNEKLITAEQLSNFYSILGDQFLNNPDLSRLALYLPFEYLPSENLANQKNISEAAQRFRLGYMKAWDQLLNSQDVRANFVDGDVLELELREGDLSRVVKAAHLIPKLMEKGFLSIDHVEDLLKEGDEVLQGSIVETIPVLKDLDLIDEGKLNEILSDYKETKLGKNKREPKETTERRKAWLQQEQQRKGLEGLGNKIAAEILQGEDIPLDGDLNEQTIIGIRGAIEILEKSDFQKAKILYSTFENRLVSSLGYQKDLAVMDELKKTFYHLHSLNIVSTDKLNNLGFAVPQLDAPGSEHMKDMQSELSQIRDITKAIEYDPVLSEYVYPVALVYGSRLKGYGNSNSDLDIAVMVKPGIPFGSKDKLTSMLRKAFSIDYVDGDVKQFWLDNSDSGLIVKDLDHHEHNLGESYWAHILFGSAWKGDTDTIQEIRKKLLTPYMYRNNQVVHDRDAHGLHLEELERDTLQYRLMHKGYRKFYPPFGGINTEHSENIDGSSVFWDSGYRTIATKLFASKVFIPQISK